MSDLSWAATKQFVHERADFTCEYCQTSQRTIGDDPANLCLSCASCNLSKAKATAAKDPLIGQTVPLFNPRTQSWSEHFQWIENGTQVLGLTPEGRATVMRFRMNLTRLIDARFVWVRGGVHPPD